jgi:hypothetical protein
MLVQPHTTLLLVTALFLLTLAPPPAHAYIDPGAGSYMLQLLLAGAVSLLFGIKVFWGKIVAFFKGKPDQEEEK